MLQPVWMALILWAWSGFRICFAWSCLEDYSTAGIETNCISLLGSHSEYTGIVDLVSDKSLVATELRPLCPAFLKLIQDHLLQAELSFLFWTSWEGKLKILLFKRLVQESQSYYFLFGLACWGPVDAHLGTFSNSCLKWLLWEMGLWLSNWKSVQDTIALSLN